MPTLKVWHYFLSFSALPGHSRVFRSIPPSSSCPVTIPECLSSILLPFLACWSSQSVYFHSPFLFLPGIPEGLRQFLLPFLASWSSQRVYAHSSFPFLPVFPEGLRQFLLPFLAYWSSQNVYAHSSFPSLPAYLPRGSTPISSFPFLPADLPRGSKYIPPSLSCLLINPDCLRPSSFPFLPADQLGLSTPILLPFLPADLPRGSTPIPPSLSCLSSQIVYASFSFPCLLINPDCLRPFLLSFLACWSTRIVYAHPPSFLACLPRGYAPVSPSLSCLLIFPEGLRPFPPSLSCLLIIPECLRPFLLSFLACWSSQNVYVHSSFPFLPVIPEGLRQFLLSFLAYWSTLIVYASSSFPFLPVIPEGLRQFLFLSCLLINPDCLRPFLLSFSCLLIFPECCYLVSSLVLKGIGPLGRREMKTNAHNIYYYCWTVPFGSTEQKILELRWRSYTRISQYRAHPVI